MANHTKVPDKNWLRRAVEVLKLRDGEIATVWSAITGVPVGRTAIVEARKRYGIAAAHGKGSRGHRRRPGARWKEA